MKENEAQFHETGFKLEEDLDFEISFYEDLVKEKPDFVDALVLLADAYTKKGINDKALEIDLRLSSLCPGDPTIHYNLACDYSVLRNADKCLETLEKAIKLGYRDFKYMEKDPDLAYVRQDVRYKELLLKHRKR
jgi:tetratricopeptide (TPR) repeat protein